MTIDSPHSLAERRRKLEEQMKLASTPKEDTPVAPNQAVSSEGLRARRAKYLQSLQNDAETKTSPREQITNQPVRTRQGRKSNEESPEPVGETKEESKIDGDDEWKKQTNINEIRASYLAKAVEKQEHQSKTSIELKTSKDFDITPTPSRERRRSMDRRQEAYFARLAEQEQERAKAALEHQEKVKAEGIPRVRRRSIEERQQEYLAKVSQEKEKPSHERKLSIDVCSPDQEPNSPIRRRPSVGERQKEYLTKVAQEKENSNKTPIASRQNLSPRSSRLQERQKEYLRNVDQEREPDKNATEKPVERRRSVTERQLEYMAKVERSQSPAEKNRDKRRSLDLARLGWEQKEEVKVEEKEETVNEKTEEIVEEEVEETVEEQAEEEVEIAKKESDIRAKPVEVTKTESITTSTLRLWSSWWNGKDSKKQEEKPEEKQNDETTDTPVLEKTSMTSSESPRKKRSETQHDKVTEKPHTENEEQSKRNSIDYSPYSRSSQDESRARLAYKKRSQSPRARQTACSSRGHTMTNANADSTANNITAYHSPDRENKHMSATDDTLCDGTLHKQQVHANTEQGNYYEHGSVNRMDNNDNKGKNKNKGKDEEYISVVGDQAAAPDAPQHDYNIEEFRHRRSRGDSDMNEESAANHSPRKSTSDTLKLKPILRSPQSIRSPDEDMDERIREPVRRRRSDLSNSVRKKIEELDNSPTNNNNRRSLSFRER